MEEDSATMTESSIISKLQSTSDLSSIHHLFSTYLHPFTAIINKQSKYSETNNAEALTTIRSLARKFTPFFNKALNIIPKRLKETPKIDASHASELFKAYTLGLSCLESVWSVLPWTPISFLFERIRLIHCYESWGRYEDAQKEGFSVLESIAKLSGEIGGNVNRGVIPELREENGDKEVAELIMEVVVTQANCVLNGGSKDEEDYRRLITMVDEIQPWLRFVDGYEYERLHKLLVSHLAKCTLFLVGEHARSDGSLVQNFCALTLSEHTKPTMNDHMQKFGRMVCDSVFSHLDDQFLCNVDILTCVLDFMAHECKDGKEKSLVDFLKVADYYAIKCLNATVDVCGALATHFDKLATKFSQVNLSPVDFITRLYAIALPVCYLNSHSNMSKKKAEKDISLPKILLNMEDHLQNLTATLGSLTRLCKITERMYVPLWFIALGFLCGPLSKLVIIESEDILCGLEDASFSIKLPNIQDAFHQFGLVFLADRTYERERDVLEDKVLNVHVLSVAVASFTLSFATKENVKESTAFLMHVISADWVTSNGLKYLYATLHNVGIVLYKANRLKEASKSFKLCRQAAWNRVLLFCKMFTASRDGFSSDSDLSEDAIAGFVTEACAESAFLLGVLYLCGSSNKMSKILADSLGSWSIAHSLFAKISCPIKLIKKWVQIACEQIDDPEAGRRIPTIYSLMSPYKVSKETFCILLEEELQAYKELKYLNPTLCNTMQMSIANILSEEIYTTKDNCLQRYRILIAKGRESRAYGVEGLNDCINFLSEAISIMSADESKDGSGPVCHLLAEVYCLRALCTQEAEPNSKHFIQDVGNALKLWLSQEHSRSAEQSQSSFTLLYYVADFLSLKGYMEHHSDIYETIIGYFTRKNIPLHECLTMLWQSRSLSHALCASPVSDAFIKTFSNHYNSCKSMEFWISCMERCKSLQAGFRQSLSVISTLSSPDSYDRHNHITIHEVKQAAFDLINSVSLSSNLLFLAAHLYYDLGETMISKGSMIEALYYAKEAHRLRTELLQKNFRCLINLQDDNVGGTGETIQTFHMHPAMATAAWPCDTDSSDFEDCILTPWNVLKVYLESTLQVGTIQEIVGNGSEAKALLLWGKNISSFQDLPIFVVGFSCALGKIYREQKLWDLAEKELESAKHILAGSYSLISCLKCRLVLEVTVDQQLGDLFQSRFNSTSGDKLLEGLSKAEIFYRSAIDKLNVSEWRNCVSDCKSQEEPNYCSQISGKETIQPKVTRKRKKTVETLPYQQSTSRMITRSCKQRGEYAQNEVKGKCPQKVDCIATCGCEDTCVSYEVNCWHCLPSEIMKSMSLRSIIQMKWECIRRRLLLRLLTEIGKCLGIGGEIQRAHEVLMESISVLVNRSTFHSLHFSISISFLARLIEKNVTADVFTVEHASILCNICWFSLGTRNDGCDVSVIPIPVIVSGLKLSFILCSEVPTIFQKVSRLLAVLYTLSSSNKAFSMLSSSGNALSESQWASYFHQASLGSHLNHHFFSRIGKQKDQKAMDVDDSSLPSSTSRTWLRLAPESVLDLEASISKFFGGLPCLPIICISMLGDDFASLLRELLPNNPSTRAWIILSRLNSDSIPIVTLLPINSILAGNSEDNENLYSGFVFSRKSIEKAWRCPWGHTIIDDVAPLFKLIIKEDSNTTSAPPLENTRKNRSLWWKLRKKLDQWLSHLLRDVEDLWFGPCKHLLLGECSANKHLESVQKKLMNDLKSVCKLDVHESIIKLITGCVGYAPGQEEWLSELILKKGCYVGGANCHDNGSCMTYSHKQGKIDNLSSVSKLILHAINEIGEENLVDREPVILVLDIDIQMLPWENLPVLRNQEVYRMPSVASISSTFERRCQYQKKVWKKDSAAVFPMVDPLDAYYLLNPDGDDLKAEATLKNWFKDQNLEGTSGTSPSVDELSVALKEHDLFMYFGHGSGLQYIPGDEIQKLDGCAAALLMGCRSGALNLNGSYIPKGAPLYYLSAGSPVIVANLWDVTSKDINKFGKALVNAWITRRRSANCAHCIMEISDKSENMMSIDGDKRKGKRKTSRKKSIESCEVNTCTFGCTNRPRIGSYMGQARQACFLPFMTGASPVCYGVPTCITNKDL